MAPSGAIRLKRSAHISLILVNVLSACLVGHTNADTVGRPALQQQAGRMAAGTPALHGMNLPIHVDHVGEADKWSKADAYMMSQIIERTSKIVSATADATVAAAEAVIEPLMQYAHVQGMVGTLVTAAHAAADAKDSIPISTDGPWPIADDADEHMMPELTDMQDWVDESYEGVPLSAFSAPTSNPGLDAYYDDLLYDKASKYDPNSAEAAFVDLYSDIHVQHQPAAIAPTTPPVTQQQHQQQQDVSAAWAARSASVKWGPSSIHKTIRGIHSSPTTSTESSTAKVWEQSTLVADPTLDVEFKRKLMQGPRRSLKQNPLDPGFIPGVIPGFIPGIGQPPGTPSPPATTTPTPPPTTTPPPPAPPTTTVAPNSPAPPGKPEKPEKPEKDEKDEKPPKPRKSDDSPVAPSPTSPTPNEESPEPEPEPSPDVDDTTSPSPVVTPSPSPKPARSPRVPAKPTDVPQDEVLPQQVQQEVEQSRNQPVSTSVKVTAAFLLRGTSASDFESRYRQAVGQVVSELSGTTVNDWSISTSEQSGGSRRLLQNSNTNLNVDMAIQTTNPKLVVFRLAKRPSAAANGCDSALCSQLVGQGVPVDTDSVLFGPEDIVNGLIVDNAIAGNPEADRLAERRNLGKIIGGSVAGAVVFALLALNYKRFIACYRSKRLVSAQKKQQKLQKQEQNTSDQTAPAATMQIDTKASVDQQQDLGSGVAKHQGLMSHQGTAAAGTPFASAPGAVHATPWVTRFSSQEVADDAVVPATPPEVHYYESNQDEVKHRNDYYLERGHTLDTEEEDLPRVPDQTHMIPKTDAAVPIYHANSDSFKLWADQQAAAAAIAAAAATNNDYAMQRSTPASSSVVEMAAMLPHSPIGSPLNSHRNSSDNMSALAQQTPVMPPPAYNPLDPMAIQQTLNHLQYLMQQQQQMMAMMSSGSITPADYPMAAGGDVAAPHGRISSPGNFIGNPAGGAYPLDVEHRSSTSAPVSGTGTPLASPSAAARMRRVGGFAFKEASVADAGGYPAIDLADVAKLAKADSASTTSSSSRRIRAVSQHGHQNMLATPFANALPGLDV